MLLRTDGGLCAVRVCGEELRSESVPHLVAVVREVDVVFLIHSLKLSMETADNHILKAVSLDASPVVHLVGGDVLHVARHVVAGVGVGAVGTDARHQLVILVGDEVLCCNLRHRVNLMIEALALCRVCHGAIMLVTALYVVKVRLLLGCVRRTENIRSLKHQVLKVMCKTRCLGRVVARAGAHGDVSLDARLLLVDRQINLQSVRQGVDACLHRVALHGLVVVGRSLTTES